MRQSLLMLTFALLLMLGAAPTPWGTLDGPIELVKPEVAVARVAACGFKSVRSRFDDTTQEDVVEISDVVSPSIQQLQCVARASLLSLYYVTFLGAAEQTYQTLYWQLSREQDTANAKAWLEKRGLLSRLPAYDHKASDESAFARALEQLCGPKAAGTIKPLGGMATFSEGALGTFDKGGHARGKLDDETLWCLVNAASASGYPLGFVGNEAYRHER